MSVDQERLAETALTVLRATVTPRLQSSPTLVRLPGTTLIRDIQLIREMAANPWPAAWIAVMRAGALAVGSWRLSEPTEKRRESPDVISLKRVLTSGPAVPAPSVLIVGGGPAIQLNVEQALLFQQTYVFPLCGRRVCALGQHEDGRALKTEFGARDTDFVLLYGRLLDVTPLEGLSL